MLFSQIKPFIRFARHLTLNRDSVYPLYTPYDARLFFVKNGSGYIEADGKLYPMKKGNTLIINSGVPYLLKAPENQITYTAFNFDYTQLHTNLKTPIVPANDGLFDPNKLVENVYFEDRILLNRVLFVPTIKVIEPFIELLLNENIKKLKDYEMKSSNLMSAILIEALRHSEVLTMESADIIKEVIDYIHNNYSSPLTNTSIAEKFGFHPYYLSSLVKSATGLSLKQYILQARIMNAAELLETGVYSVGEISEKCGFYDIYHFSKYFKKVMKVAPSDFLKNN